MKIVHISDTHNKHNKVKIPECDVLIHSGDISFRGQYSEVKNFAKWFEKQPARHKIFVPGNHELVFENELPLSKTWFTENCPSGILLIEEEIVIDGIKIFGSPISPWFHNWAWNRGIDEIKKHWDIIPDDVNVLITHGPPYRILDQLVYASGVPNGMHVGCAHLLDRVRQLKQLKLHLFGHIHCDRGHQEVFGIHFYNGSICDEMYFPSYEPHIIEI